MLQINLETNINNINYIRYMEYKDNENGDLKRILESDKTTSAEDQETKK